MTQLSNISIPQINLTLEKQNMFTWIHLSLLTLNFYYSQLSCTTASRISKKVPKKDSKRQKNDSNKKCSRKDGEK
jgi:hypothetical protein